MIQREIEKRKIIKENERYACEPPRWSHFVCRHGFTDYGQVIGPFSVLISHVLYMSSPMSF